MPPQDGVGRDDRGDRAQQPTTQPVPAPGQPAPVLIGQPEASSAQLRADGIPGQAVCIVSGALDAIERVLQAHLRPGDRVAVENPGYAALFDLLDPANETIDAVDGTATPDRALRVVDSFTVAT